MTTATGSLRDQLQRQTSVAAAKEAEVKSDWGNFRNPVLAGRGTLQEITGPYNVKEGNFEQTVVRLHFSDFTAYEFLKVPNIVDGHYEIDIRLPKEPNVNAEMQQMAMSAGVDSIFDLEGSTFTIKAATFKFMGRKNTKVKDASGQDIWEDDEFTTKFYAVSDISGGNAGNGTTADVVVVEAITDDQLTAACAYVVGKKAEEVDPSTMMKALAANGVDSGALNEQIALRTFIDGQIEAGHLVVDAEGVLQLA